MLLKKHTVVYMAAFLLLVSALGYGQQAKVMTYSTKNPEALKFFQEGLDLFDNFRIAEAEPLFEKAVKADSGFALAYDYWAATASSGEEGWKRMNKAMQLAPSASEPERVAIMVDKAMMENKMDVARQNFVRLIELVPDDKRAHYYYAGFLNSQRDDVDAEKEYRKVMTMAPDFAPVYNDYAYFLSRLGRYPEAIKSLQKYAELEPREANPHDSMGEIYLYMGDYPNSLKEYQNSLNLNPNFVASYAGLGHNLVFQGKYEDARAKYNDMRVHARSVSDTNMAFYWTSVSYIYEKKYDAAIGTFNDEMSFAQARNNIYLVPEIHFDLAVIYTDKGDLDKALNELALEREAAANQGIDSLSQKGYLRDCLRMEADILARQGKIDMADARLAEYQKAISGLNNPALMRYYHGAAGIIAYYKKDYPTAISELKQSDPQNQYHKYLLGLSYEAAGQNEQAKKAFTEIAKYNHNDLAYSIVRGKATAKM